MREILKYFLFYFVLAYSFRIAIDIIFTKKSFEDSILFTIADPKIFIYTMVLALMVAVYTIRKRKKDDNIEKKPPN